MSNTFIDEVLGKAKVMFGEREVKVIKKGCDVAAGHVNVCE